MKGVTRKDRIRNVDMRGVQNRITETFYRGKTTGMVGPLTTNGYK